METNIKEKFIQKGITPVSLEITEKIISQMKKCACKIYINGEKGTGFFTKIPYKNDLLKVLITNNHILGENEIKNNKSLTITLNNEKVKKFIKINNNRKRYTNEILDITIIEIDEKKDDIHDYIELDKDIINLIKLSKNEIINNYKDIYKNQSIYILNYLKGENILVSYGLLSEINDENGINHNCNTDYGSSGSPILSLKNNGLIGIHYGSSKFEFNKGTLIIYPIIEFQNIKNNLYIIKKEEISNFMNNKMDNRNFNNFINENNMNNMNSINMNHFFNYIYTMTISQKNFPNDNQDLNMSKNKIKLWFQLENGKRLEIFASKHISIKDALLLFLRTIGEYEQNLLSYMFLYDGKCLDNNSKVEIGEKFINNSIILVIDNTSRYS